MLQGDEAQAFYDKYHTALNAGDVEWGEIVEKEDFLCCDRLTISRIGSRRRGGRNLTHSPGTDAAPATRGADGNGPTGPSGYAAKCY